jgi:hypothetical protein
MTYERPPMICGGSRVRVGDDHEADWLYDIGETPPEVVNVLRAAADGGDDFAELHTHSGISVFVRPGDVRTVVPTYKAVDERDGQGS